MQNIAQFEIPDGFTLNIKTQSSRKLLKMVDLLDQALRNTLDDSEEFEKSIEMVEQAEALCPDDYPYLIWAVAEQLMRCIKTTSKGDKQCLL